MPDVVTGIVGGTSLLGAASSASAADEAADSAAYSARLQAEAAEAELNFAKEKYADWESVYGPIQESLASYYSSLGPEYYEAQGLEAFQKEQEQAFTNLRESLVQRGVWDSGVGAAVELQQALHGAETRADIRLDAPRMAAEDKRQFLQVGLGQDPSGDIQQALRSMTGVRGQQAGYQQQQATLAGQQAGQAFSSAINTTGTALADYFSQPAVGSNQDLYGSATPELSDYTIL